MIIILWLYFWTSLFASIFLETCKRSNRKISELAATRPITFLHYNHVVIVSQYCNLLICIENCFLFFFLSVGRNGLFFSKLITIKKTNANKKPFIMQLFFYPHLQAWRAPHLVQSERSSCLPCSPWWHRGSSHPWKGWHGQEEAHQALRIYTSRQFTIKHGCFHLLAICLPSYEQHHI